VRLATGALTFERVSLGRLDGSGAAPVCVRGGARVRVKAMAPRLDTLLVDDVAFDVRWSRRRRTIGISIPREGAPLLAVPVGCRRATLETAVRAKLPWVRHKLGERAARPELVPRRFETGERFPYLGRQYDLVVVGDDDAAGEGARSADTGEGATSAGCEQLMFVLSSGGSKGGVRLGDDTGRPPLRLRDGRFELARAAQTDGRAHFLAWYRRRAARVLNERIRRFAPLVGVTPPTVRIKEMRSRWGSCSAKGRISLHWGLVLLPLDLADYVVVHELAHLRELNHGQTFWRGVEQVLPDYRERRKRLRSEGSRSVF
jgi:predicted metal-dependent hydrolase